MHWLRFFLRPTMPILMEGMESAFEMFGGVSEHLRLSHASHAAMTGKYLQIAVNPRGRPPFRLSVMWRGCAIGHGHRKVSSKN